MDEGFVHRHKLGTSEEGFDPEGNTEAVAGFGGKLQDMICTPQFIHDIIDNVVN